MADALSEAHRRAQARLSAIVAAQILLSWKMLDPENLDDNVDAWLGTTVPLVQASRVESARLAGAYLTAFRTNRLGVTSDDFSPILASAIPPQQVSTSLLVTGPVAIKAAMRRGVPLATAVDTAKATSARAATRHVTDGGRETVERTVKIDPRGRGWVRVLSAKACPFCQSLAAEGDAFTSHDGCSCSAEPAYA